MEHPQPAQDPWFEYVYPKCALCGRTAGRGFHAIHDANGRLCCYVPRYSSNVTVTQSAAATEGSGQ